MNGVKVYYEYIDNDSDNNIILLHGWGQNIKMMKILGNKLENDYNYLYIDLPGFGKSMEPLTTWSVYDYCECVKELIDSLSLKNIIIIGHSFGGKIALVYASKYRVNKLICLASPFRKSLKKIPAKVKIYKFFKRCKFLRNILGKYIGSTDYNNASLIMKKVLVNTVNLDISSDIKKITNKTLLIWGSNDAAVKIEDAYVLKDLIKNSELIIYNSSSHYAYLEEIDKVSNDIKRFLEMEDIKCI